MVVNKSIQGSLKDQKLKIASVGAWNKSDLFPHHHVPNIVDLWRVTLISDYVDEQFLVNPFSPFSFKHTYLENMVV